MKETITVFTGELKAGNQSVDLKSSPIGSCVVIVLFEEEIMTGGMAHVMLPGKAPEKDHVMQGRYAENAIDLLINELTEHGLNKEKLKAVVVGGGNVLKRENDTIGIENLKSVNQLLEKHEIKTVAYSVKGTERKSVRFDISQGTIFFTKGDEPEKELYRISNELKLIDSNNG